jgi:hypothetical protein
MTSSFLAKVDYLKAIHWSQVIVSPGSLVVAWGDYGGMLMSEGSGVMRAVYPGTTFINSACVDPGAMS